MEPGKAANPSMAFPKASVWGTDFQYQLQYPLHQPHTLGSGGRSHCEIGYKNAELEGLVAILGRSN